MLFFELFDNLDVIIDVRFQKIKAIKVFLIIYKYKQQILHNYITLLKNFEKNIQSIYLIRKIFKIYKLLNSYFQTNK